VRFGAAWPDDIAHGVSVKSVEASMKIAKSILAGLALTGAVLPALAQQAARPLSTAYTDISRKLCKSDHAPNASLDEHEAISYSCKGVAGLRVDVVYGGTSLRVTLRDPKTANVQPQLGASYDIGDRIEWRGRPGPKGFKPEAAILRLKGYVNDDTVATHDLGSVLAILRVSGGAVCPAAFLDAAATPQANEAARRIADETAAAFRCGTDQPRIVGPETSLVKETIARSGPPTS
jgi:hypothetical protein